MGEGRHACVKELVLPYDVERPLVGAVRDG